MAKLERFGHGGDIWTAEEMTGSSAEQFIDFSSNIVPFGPPTAVIKRLQECLLEPTTPVLTRYPDPDSRKLKQALALFHRIEPEQILIGNGAAELIDLLVTVLKPSRVGVVEPAFAEYSASAKKREIPVQALVTRWEHQFLPSLTELKELMEQTELVFIGVPNNPTGHMIPVSWLEEIAASDTWLVLDEAFIDFISDGEERSFIPNIHTYSNVVVVRSMTKFFSLPGLRLGYLVADPAVIERCKQMQIPWNVNGLAQEAGLILLQDSVYKPYVQEVKDWLEREKKGLTISLQESGIFEIFPSEANYLLLRLTEKSCFYPVAWWQEQLVNKGFLIRDCSMYQGLDQRYMRIAIKGRDQNQQLVQAIKEIWNESGNQA